MFKNHTSRFAALAEKEIKIVEHKNNFSKFENKGTPLNLNKKSNYSLNNAFSKEHQLKNLAPKNFPALISEKNINTKSLIEISFSEKVKEKIEHVEETYEENVDFESINPGWVVLNASWKKLLKKTKFELKNHQPETEIDNETATNIFNNLVSLHKTRTDKYINMWGYDEWEKMTQFPNYDYNYFDKLDELYEKEMNI